MKKFTCLILIIMLSFVFLYTDDNIIPQEKEELLDDITKCTEKIMIFELERLQEITKKNEIIENNWNEIKLALSEGSKSRINSLSWFALPDGSYYTVEKNKVSANLSSRKYFPTLLAGKPVFGAPVVGRTSGKQSLVVALPIVKNDVITGILGTSFYVNDLRKFLLNYICIDDDQVFSIITDDFLTILDSSDPDLTFDKPLLQDSKSMKDAVKTIVKMEKGTVSYKWKSENKTAYFKKSHLTNWHYVVLDKN